jgi:hypothetical protein
LSAGLLLMRLAGWLLLVVGTLLCVSIVWATIGFLMMGFGLICLLIAEKKRNRATTVAAPPVVSRQARLATQPRFEPVVDRPAPAPPPKPGATAAARTAVVASAIAKIRQDNSAYDIEKWNALVESDPDLARLVEALAPYGRQYVDELAAVYLVLDDKNYLPVIVDEIIASARRHASQPRAEAVTAGVSDANDIRRGKTSGVRSSRSGDLLRAASAPREPIAVDHVAVADPVAVAPEPEPTETVADLSGADASMAVAATSEPEPAKIAPGPVVTVAPRVVPGTEAIRTTVSDDAKDLQDLFKQLGSA